MSCFPVVHPVRESFYFALTALQPRGFRARFPDLPVQEGKKIPGIKNKPWCVFSSSHFIVLGLSNFHLLELTRYYRDLKKKKELGNRLQIFFFLAEWISRLFRATSLPSVLCLAPAWRSVNLQRGGSCSGSIDLKGSSKDTHAQSCGPRSDFPGPGRENTFKTSVGPVSLSPAVCFQADFCLFKSPCHLFSAPLKALT